MDIVWFESGNQIHSGLERLARHDLADSGRVIPGITPVSLKR